MRTSASACQQVASARSEGGVIASVPSGRSSTMRACTSVAGVRCAGGTVECRSGRNTSSEPASGS